MARLLDKLNAFPVNRDNPGPSAIKYPIRLLKAGKIVGIFPSGKISKEEAPLKKGAVLIAMRSNVPLIPAVYIGPQSFKELFSFKKGKLIIGKPIPICSAQEASHDKRLEQTLTDLENAFEQLEIQCKGQIPSAAS